LAKRVGVGGWRTETHVIAALWSSEILRTIGMHRASFAAVCPDSVADFEAWWRKDPPAAGRHSILVVLDPAHGIRRDRRRWLGLVDLAGARPRYRGYAEAAELLGLGDR
jgi:hypothetical protein